MKENSIETRLRKEVEKLGGKAYKFVSPGNAGVPDRLIALPGKPVMFVETKRPKDGKLSKIQEYQIRRLRELGNRVEVLSSYEQIDKFIRSITDEI